MKGLKNIDNFQNVNFRNLIFSHFVQFNIAIKRIPLYYFWDSQHHGRDMSIFSNIENSIHQWMNKSTQKVPPIKCNLLSTSTKIRQYNHSTLPFICMTSSAICLGRFFWYARIHSVKTPYKRIGCAVCTPSMRSDNSLHAASTPWALHDHAVNRRSERRGRSSETLLSPWARRDICTLWKMWNYLLYFVVFSCDPTALWEISNRRANAVRSQ